MTPSDKVEILGLHKVPVEMTEWADPGIVRDARVDNLWLIELRFLAPIPEFDPEEYTQEDPDLPRDRWQIAYQQEFLNATGTRKGEPPRDFPKRVVFFLHYLRPGEPLRTPFGKLALPPATPIPERLRSLVFYRRP